eukprot:254048-Ditylum_brightwellii.AAC.1
MAGNGVGGSGGRGYSPNHYNSNSHHHHHHHNHHPFPKYGKSKFNNLGGPLNAKRGGIGGNPPLSGSGPPGGGRGRGRFSSRGG